MAPVADDESRVLLDVALVMTDRAADLPTSSPWRARLLRFARALERQVESPPLAHTGPRPEQLRRRALDQHRESEQAWRSSSAWYRERALLEALGDQRLTVKELTGKMNAALSEPDGRPTAYQPEVRRLADRMVHAGQLQRELEAFKSRGRYRYWRRDALEGPIAGLERAYREGGA